MSEQTPILQLSPAPSAPVPEAAEPVQSIQQTEAAQPAAPEVVEAPALDDSQLTDAEKKAIDDFIAEKQKSTYIVIDPMFQGCDFQRKGWIK